MQNSSNNNIIDNYCDSIWVEKGLSKNTIDSYASDLQQLEKWLSAKNIDIKTCSEIDLNSYLADKIDRGISSSSINRALSAIKGFYNWLTYTNVVKVNPSELIESPKIGRKLPVNLSEQDVEKLLNAPDCTTPQGKRDKTILELLYATGLRISELTDLKLNQVDMTRGIIRVLGKGGKERIIPIGETALTWLKSYIDSERVDLVTHDDNLFIFLSNRGRQISRKFCWTMIVGYSKKSLKDKTIR